MIVDAHAHAWPDAVAARALKDSELSLKRYGDGTVDGLRAAMEAAGVDKAVCLAVAPRGDHVQAANRFVGSLDRDRFIGFGSIHPDLPAEELIRDLDANRLKGVKVHPAFQSFRLDDPRLDKIWSALEGRFTVTIHVGKVGAHDDGSGCTPAMVRSVVERFPGLEVIGCHFGGFMLLPEAEEQLLGQPLYLDTSWPPSTAELEPERVRDLILRHGPERIIFGSDWPMASPSAEIQAIRDLGLSGQDTAGILGGNFMRLRAAQVGRG